MKVFIKIIFISCIAVLMTMPVSAVEFFFDAKTTAIAIGDEVKIDFLINTEKDDINALEAVIVFPHDSLEIEEIRDGGSLINFWVERPHEREGAVRFSGIVPGGYRGSRGLLFSVVFRAKKEGSGLMVVRDLSALRNDGAGTAAKAYANPLQITVSGRLMSAVAQEAAIEDHTPPEAFTLEIAHDQNIFDGKYFLVFATQDKESGIDYYEVREGARSPIRAVSPYVLQNQKRDEKIEVRAVDKRENERIARLAPQETYVVYRIVAILMLVLIVGVAIQYRRKKKK